MLGYDDEVSQDHDWGPRVMLFFRSEVPEVGERLNQSLPKTYAGFPVCFPGGSHRVECLVWDQFRAGYLGIQGNPRAADWLHIPSQHLLTFTTGPLFFDEIGVEQERNALGWYPDDVWRYLLACQWQRIGQEEHLAPRAGSIGDSLGSIVITARLVRDVMRSAFLLERKYPPYPKWFGHAFSRLESARVLFPPLSEAITSSNWLDRNRAMASACEVLAEMQNRVGLCEPRPSKAIAFHDRPFLVVEHGSQFAEALLAAITDPEVRSWADKPLVGGIDTYSDSTDYLVHFRSLPNPLT